MSPVAAEAWKVATENQYAIPAREQTRQEIERSSRHKWSVGTIYAAMALLALLTAWEIAQGTGQIVWSIVGICLLAVFERSKVSDRAKDVAKIPD